MVGHRKPCPRIFSQRLTVLTIMRHQCISCDRLFKSSVSLDKHSCRGPARKTRNSARGATSRRPKSSASRPTKRVRLVSPQVNDDTVAQPHDMDLAGASSNPPHSPPQENPPPDTRSVRSGRVIRIPPYLADYVPHGDMSLAHVPPRAPTPPESDDRFPSPPIEDTHAADEQPHPFQTAVNKIGVFRRYTHAPSWFPKNDERVDLVCDSPTIDTPPPVHREVIHEISRSMYKPFEPFPNFSTAMFMAAYFSGMDMKSEAHATTLAKTTQHPRFQWEELKNFNAHVENVHLNNYLKRGGHPFQTENGWQEATVYIRLPVENRRFRSEAEAEMLPIYGLYHRRITDIIRSVCASSATASFHFTPFTMHWTPDSAKPHEHERVYADTYMSDSMIQAQTAVDAIPRAEGDTKERVVLGLMLASDSAQLTSFGTASVWPIYLMFANQPKQERARPSCRAVHHLAYVPSVSILAIGSPLHLTDSHLAWCRLR